MSIVESVSRPDLPRVASPGATSTAAPAGRFILGWTAAWGLVGCAVATGVAIATDVDFRPVLLASILFAEVVGFTAYTSARLVFPLFARLPFTLRLFLEVITVLSGTVFGSIAVILFQPLFSVGRLGIVALIVLVNAVIAVIIGIALNTYDNMKHQIEASYHALREKEVLERELGFARDVQQQLLPRTPPAHQGLQLAGVCRPAVAVGGDYYDFLPLSEDQLGLVIADVSGKGFPAALLMAGLQASVRSLCGPLSHPGPLNGQLNQHLCRSSSSARYATLFLGFYDLVSRTLCYSNAGHYPPLLIRRDSVARLNEGGIPIGLFDHAEYREGRLQLEPGDLLALFTDGVIEAPNDVGEEFGELRLLALLREHRDHDLEFVIATVLGKLEEWSGGAAAFDDVTLLLARPR